MKKWLSILLILTLLCSLMGCAGDASQTTGAAESTAGQDAAGPLLVGYGREDITPKKSVPLDGYGNANSRMSNNVLDPLYVTCLAFTQGEQTMLLFSQDLISTREDVSLQLRYRLVRQLEVPSSQIVICSTHTHSAPNMGSTSAVMDEYREEYYAAAVAAAKAALEDRCEAELYGAKTQTENLNFVRHYVRADGTYTGSSFGKQSTAEIVGHAEDGDRELRVVQIAREGKKDILLMNWQTHPCFTGGSAKKDVSADYIGAVRSKIEGDTDMLFVFFNGAAGNQNPWSELESEKTERNVIKYAEQLGQYAIDALKNKTKIEGSGIQIKQLKVTYQVNREGLDKLQEARDVNEYYKSSGVLADSQAYAWQHGFSSVYEASAIVSRAEWPETDTMELGAVNVAGLAFVTAPYEMFSGSALYIKENSPFDMTLIMGYANNTHRYFPTQNAYDYGSYEAVTSYFARGCAEMAAEKFVELLKELK